MSSSTGSPGLSVEKATMQAARVTKRFEGKIPRLFSKTLDFALLLKRLRDFCGIAGKIL